MLQDCRTLRMYDDIAREIGTPSRAAIQSRQRGPWAVLGAFRLDANGIRPTPTLACTRADSDVEWADLTMTMRHRRDGHPPPRLAASVAQREAYRESIEAFPIQPGQSSGKDTSASPVPSGFYPLEKAVL